MITVILQKNNRIGSAPIAAFYATGLYIDMFVQFAFYSLQRVIYGFRRLADDFGDLLIAQSFEIKR